MTLLKKPMEELHGSSNNANEVSLLGIGDSTIIDFLHQVRALEALMPLIYRTHVLWHLCHIYLHRKEMGKYMC